MHKKFDQIKFDRLFGKNTQEAKEYLVECASGDDIDAQVILANAYMDEKFDYKDKERATDLYLKAARKDDKSAAFQLAGIYEEMAMDGDRSKKEEMLYWYEKAASFGLVDAMYSLGSLYEWGGILEQDNEKSIQWYKKASVLNDTDSIRALADLYLKLEKPQKAIEALKLHAFDDLQSKILMLKIYKEHRVGDVDEIKIIQKDILKKGKSLIKRKSVVLGVFIGVVLVVLAGVFLIYGILQFW